MSSTNVQRNLITSNTAPEPSSQKQVPAKSGKRRIPKHELILAYSDYRWLTREIGNFMSEDCYYCDDDTPDRLTNDFMIAWGKYWDVCVKMHTERYKEFRGRKRNLRYALIKQRAGNREKLMRLDPEYLKRERLPLPNDIAGIQE